MIFCASLPVAGAPHKFAYTILGLTATAEFVPRLYAVVPREGQSQWILIHGFSPQLFTDLRSVPIPTNCPFDLILRFGIGLERVTTVTITCDGIVFFSYSTARRPQALF